MPTTAPKLPIFRSKTLEKYRQNREKSVLPRVLTPPIFVSGWIVLTLLISAGIAVWFGPVPLYVTGSGAILDTNSTTNQNDEATATILLPATDISSIRSGLPVQITIGQTGLQLKCVINGVNRNLLSPQAAHLLYGFEATGPSLVVTVELGPTISKQLYSGSPIQAQIQIGSQSVLAFFPGISSLLKGQ